MIWRALFGCVTFALLFLVLHPRDIVAALAQARFSFFLCGFALCLFSLVARAWRWMLVLHHMGLRVPFRRVLEAYTISYWFNTFMPGSLGGDLYKLYDMSQATSKKLRPAAAVFVERVTGLLALLLVAVVALAVFHDRVPVPPWILGLLLSGAAAATVLVLLAVLRFDSCWSLTVRFLPAARRVLSDERVESIGAVCREMRAKPVIFVQALLLGLGIQVLSLFTYYLLGLALTDKIPGVYFFTMLPLIEIASMAPITINGIGLKEAMLVFSLNYADVGPAFAMGLGILFRIVAILLALLGGLLLVLRKPSESSAAVRSG